MARRRRTILLFPLVILVCSLVGGVFGPGLLGAPAASSEDDIKNSLKNFTRVFELVEENFADKIQPDKAIYKGAIPGMLRTLDPHSNFFDPRDYQLMREDQKGRYYGVGMTVQPRNGKTVVLAPFVGFPAYKAGIRPGDVILEVNDKKTDNMTTTEVADLLKGPRGTTVTVIVAREGVEKPMAFHIQRDEISRKSVKDMFFVQPGIAYLDIESFNENTSHEMDDNFKRLGEENVKGLILDLRENPGGLLNEGVAVADHFLHRGQAIVSHRGRTSAEKPYQARRGNRGFDYPIVVLVNRYSASAAEIVSGALQDHDRAWVLGDNTFGKGLVQTVFPLSENTGLALTTAHFYTPSGRLIQRDYTNTSFYDYYYRKDTTARNPNDVHSTDSGRTVYGGGGISPDEKFTVPKLNKLQTDLIRKFAFATFTTKYFASHDPKTISKTWEPSEAMLIDFHKQLLDNKFTFTEAEYIENLPWIKQQLRQEIFMTAFSEEDARRVAVENDPMVQRAITSMPKAKSLLDTMKKTMALRTR